MAITPGKKGGPTHLGGRPIIVRAPDARWVSLQSDSGVVYAKLVNVTTTGGGGVESISRPRRTALTDWTGAPPEGLSLEMMMDGWPMHSVEGQIRMLERMAGAFTGGAPPEEISLSGPAVPHALEQAPQNRWLISEPPEWGDTIRDSQGLRQRQYVTLALLLVNDSVALERVKPRQTPAPSFKGTAAQLGDTFETIAKNKLGSAKLAHPLRRLNVEQGIAFFKHWRSASKKIPEGTPVRLPSADLLKKWKRELKSSTTDSSANPS